MPGRRAGARGGAVVEGLRIVAGSRVLWTTLLALAISMFGLGAVNVLFLPLVVEVLQVNPVWLGAIELAQSVSMILAAGIVAVLAARLRPTTIVTVGILAAGVLVGLTGAVDRGLAGRPPAVRHRLVHHAAPGVGRDDHADRRAGRRARPGDGHPPGVDVRRERRLDGPGRGVRRRARHPRGVLRRRPRIVIGGGLLAGVLYRTAPRPVAADAVTRRSAGPRGAPRPRHAAGLEEVRG